MRKIIWALTISLALELGIYLSNISGVTKYQLSIVLSIIIYELLARNKNSNNSDTASPENIGTSTDIDLKKRGTVLKNVFEISNQFRKVKTATAILVIITYIFWVIKICFSTSNLGNSLGKSFELTIIMPTAIFFLGGLFGILFASSNKKIEPSPFSGKHIISSNTNLERVSDWLTKLIFGLALTQLFSIPTYLRLIEEKIKTLLGPVNGSYDIFIGVAVSLLVLGFLSIYKFTELYLRRSQFIFTTEMKFAYLMDSMSSIKEEIESTGMFRNDIKVKKEMTRLIKLYKETVKEYFDNQIDFQKGKWGGKNESNGRRLSAFIEAGAYGRKIMLEVDATDLSKPLTNIVIFHLHPSFSNASVEVKVQNNKAQLEVIVLFPFTVGVECDNNQTKLELDLSELIASEISDFIA